MDVMGNTVAAFGTATAPAINAAIVTIPAASLPPGLYHVAATVAYGATAGNSAGMELRAGATVISRILQLAVVNTTSPIRNEFYRILDGSTAVSLNANTAGPAGSVYNAMLTATRIRGV